MANNQEKQALAAAWALNQLGSRDYYNLCQRFIENAYGTSGQYRSAAAASGALNWGTDFDQADVGDLVFFRPDQSNGNYGHVGIYLGNGEMVSATNGGITRDNIQTNPYWRNLFVGFGDPPDQWKGQAKTNDLIAGASSLVQKAKIAVGNAFGARQAASNAYWGAAAPYAEQIVQAAAAHDVPANVLAGLLIQESGGNARAVSKAGAQGLMQFMPGTARGMGIDPFDPAQAIDGGARYLKQLADQSGGDWEQAVGKYNAGPAGNLNNAETRNHMQKVMAYADQIGAGMGGGDVPLSQPSPNANPYRGSDRGAGTDMGPTVDDIREMLTDILGRAPTGQEIQNALRSSRIANPQAPSSAGRLSGGGRMPPWTSEQNLRSGLSGLLDQIGQWAGNLDIRSGQRQPSGGTPYAPGVPGMEGITSGGTPRQGTPGVPGILAGSEAARVAGAAGEALGGIWGNSTIGQALGASPPALPPPAPGGPGGGGPPGGGDLIDPATGAPISRSTQADGVASGGAVAGAARSRPSAWIDPTNYTGINRGIVETANGLTQQIQDAQDELSKLTGTDAKSMIRREELQKAINDAQTRLVTLSPQLRQIEQEEQGTREGTVAPGSTPYMKKIPVYRKVDGKWQIEYIDNPNAMEDPSITRQGMADTAALARQQAGDVAAGQRNAADIASREKVAGIQEEGALERAGIAANTSRVTTALAQAVEQRRQDIDAQIRAGDLDLRTATEQFNQWYKQNVEAPLAILDRQRQSEAYKVQQQQAITQRATGQAEHERGIANIGQQMWGQAAQAYNQMIPLTVGAGWGEGFQRNLQGQGFTPNQGATYNVPESLDAFATRKVAEMLQGVSPYADSILQAQGQLGNPGQAMGGQQMDALTQQATNTASNALANPFQMGPPTPFQMPGQVDIAGMAGAGMQNGPALTNQLDQYLPRYGQ